MIVSSSFWADSNLLAAHEASNRQADFTIVVVGLFLMFINIQLYKHEPVKETASAAAVADRASLEAFELGSDVDEEDLEARLRLSTSSGEDDDVVGGPRKSQKSLV